MLSRKTITKVSALLAVVSLSASALSLLTVPTYAAGLTTTLTPSAQSVSINGNVVLTFTPVTAVTNGSTITVAFPAGYTGGAALTNADVAVTGTNITSTVSSGFTATGFTSTLTTSANVTTPITITIGGTNKLTSPVTAGNYGFLVNTSVGDTGGVFQYVGQANVVQVRAFVPTTLSFAIRNTTDTANINTCDLGTLTTAAIGTCSYRLKVGTNASNGYTVSVATSGGLTNGTKTFSDAAAGAAGTEKYGATITGGSTTSASAVTVATAYNAGATNGVLYTNVAPALLLTAAGSNNPATTDVTNTALVTHKAAIAADTAAGLYTQTVTYTVTPSF